MITADSAIVNHDVPSPESNGIPLSKRKRQLPDGSPNLQWTNIKNQTHLFHLETLLAALWGFSSGRFGGFHSSVLWWTRILHFHVGHGGLKSKKWWKENTGRIKELRRKRGCRRILLSTSRWLLKELLSYRHSLRAKKDEQLNRTSQWMKEMYSCCVGPKGSLNRGWASGIWQFDCEMVLDGSWSRWKLVATLRTEGSNHPHIQATQLAAATHDSPTIHSTSQPHLHLHLPLPLPSLSPSILPSLSSSPSYSTQTHCNKCRCKSSISLERLLNHYQECCDRYDWSRSPDHFKQHSMPSICHHYFIGSSSASFISYNTCNFTATLWRLSIFLVLPRKTAGRPSTHITAI